MLNGSINPEIFLKTINPEVFLKTPQTCLVCGERDDYVRGEEVVLSLIK